MVANQGARVRMVVASFINAHAALYAVLACLAWLAVMLWVGRRALAAGRQVAPATGVAWVVRGWVLLALFAVLVLFRGPLLAASNIVHVDEVEFLVAAQNLRADPVPWRGADAHSSGPLNLYPLTLACALGLPVTYFTTHLLALLMLAGVLYLTYAVAALWLGEWPALIGTGVGYWLAVFTGGVDYVSYNSLYPSCLLLAVALWALSQAVRRAPRAAWWAYAGGSALGAVPYAKLQAVPVGLVLAVTGIAVLWPAAANGRRWRTLAAWLAGGGSVPAAFALVALATDTLTDFTSAYLAYGMAFGSPTASPWRGFLQVFIGPDCLTLLVHAGLLFAGLLLLAGARAVRAHLRRYRWHWLVAGALLAAALYGVYAPRMGRAFYAALVLQPLMLLVALAAAAALDRPSAPATAALVQRRRVAAWVLLLAVVAWQGYVWKASLLPGYRQADTGYRLRLDTAPHWVAFLPVASHEPSLVARYLATHAQPGDRLAIWGWAPWDYLDSGLRPGTREALINGPTTPAHTWYAAMSPALVAYYQRRFLSDLQRSQPAYFVDATCSSAFFFGDRATFGHETFPALAAYVAENYTLAASVGPKPPDDATRIYVAKVRVGAAFLPAP